MGKGGRGEARQRARRVSRRVLGGKRRQGAQPGVTMVREGTLDHAAAAAGKEDL